MNTREVTIRKVENGYVIKTAVIRNRKSNNVEAMIKLMRAMGMYESWQEHKEEEIRKALESMAVVPFPEREEKEVVCTTLEEVNSFLREFFEGTLPDTISI